jgi:NADH-quinone oxidoreductase subunit L
MNLPFQIPPHLLGAAGEAHEVAHGVAEAGHAAAAHEVIRLVPHASSLLFLIPLLPLIGFAVNALAGARIQRSLGKAANHSIAIGAMVVSWLVGLVCAAQLIGAAPADRMLRQVLWNIVDTHDGFQLNLAFALDPLSMMMVLIITTIGTLIHVYSIGYMEDEKSYWRFFAYLNLFVFAMLLLVMGDNFGVMFFGWEGVGLASYLLIAFWYEDPEKAKAGMKAFVVNRIGDFGFLVGMLTLFWALSGQLVGPVQGATPTLTFHELRDQFAFGGVGEALSGKMLWGLPVLTVACLGLFIGATGKSAQIPLYVWLPDAMAGPTPVSALIHAATMVTAGVYMIGRLNFLFALSPEAMTVVAVVAAATALFAASIGFFQHDIKKVLAYSTVSQLGFMFIGVGVGAYWTGLYHLLTHAFFKATLFLGSGAVIYGCHHNQDMRKMGGLKSILPITERTYFYACICITAAPVFFLGNGFFSKDEILWNAFRAGDNLLIPGWIIWAIGQISAIGTAFYMWRSYYMTFTGEYRGDLGHGEGHGGAAGHAHAAAAAATHSLGAAHADTFDADVIASSNVAVAHLGDDAHAAAHGRAHDDADDQGAHAHHGGPPKDVPRSMSYVLAALSVGSALSILLGFWAPLGHVLHIEWMTEPILERWLAPALTAASLTAARQANPGAAWEWGLIVLSVGGALGGWAVARALYLDNKSPVPARLLARFPRLHAVVYNKYYVDEIYAATVLNLVAFLREAFYWFDRTVIDGILHLAAAVARFFASVDGAIDRYVVDGAVNLFASGVIAQGRKIRELETGRVQSYLYAVLAGALVIIAGGYLASSGGDELWESVRRSLLGWLS